MRSEVRGQPAGLVRRTSTSDLRSGVSFPRYPPYGDYGHQQYPPAPPPGSIDIEKEAPHGIHVANWRWTEVGLFFTFTAFIVIVGLAKVGKLALPWSQHCR